MQPLGFKHPKAPTSWKEYVEAVAKKAAKKHHKTVTPKMLANLRPFNIGDKWPCPPEKRCQAVTKSLGRQCKRYAVRGATRCVVHGGLREVPDHPSSLKAWQKGYMDTHERHRQAVHWNATEGKDDAHRVKAELRTLGIPAQPVNVQSAIQAQRMDDGGKAWRRFLASHKPPSQPQPEDIEEKQ